MQKNGNHRHTFNNHCCRDLCFAKLVACNNGVNTGIVSANVYNI